MSILILRRSFEDTDDNIFYGPPVFAFVSLLLLICCCVGVLLYLRRARRQAPLLPQHQRNGHQRTLTITASSSTSRNSVYVYDEKMNLIANSSTSPNSPVPEIHVTFPDEEHRNGQTTAGRVVVLRISESGSVGMEPLHRDQLPPYQRTDSERFQSLDLARIGGLQEKSVGGPRYS